jgi:hypothetical protein
MIPSVMVMAAPEDSRALPPVPPRMAVAARIGRASPPAAA